MASCAPPKAFQSRFKRAPIPVAGPTLFRAGTSVRSGSNAEAAQTLWRMETYTPKEQKVKLRVSFWELNPQALLKMKDGGVEFFLAPLPLVRRCATPSLERVTVNHTVRQLYLQKVVARAIDVVSKGPFAMLFVCLV